MKQIHQYLLAAAVLGLAAAGVSCAGATPAGDQRIGKGEIRFHDAHQQAEEFIHYYHSIALTPDQEKIKEAVLSRIPAPCCSDYSIATCCCPCNLAKSVWGLTHYLVAEKGYDAGQLKLAVERWVRFTNESGYAGNACYMGRCGQPFAEDGCGGMDERRIS
jgi:hypothetical protein